jgi:Carboxypeptidase regulatory-like domain/TonB dependent receptor
MGRIAKEATLVAIVIMVIAVAGRCQITTGVVTGRVVDATVAAIPQVQLTLVNVGTGIKQTSVTSDQGNYTFTQVPPGIYKLTALAKGFGTVIQEGINVQVNEATPVNFTLKPATVEEKEEVLSSTPAMQTESAAVGGVVDHNTIISLPLNGRNFIQLVALEPGVSSSAKLQGGGVDYTTQVFGGNYSVNGTPASGSSYMLDGIEIRDVVDTRVTFQPTLEFIQEFNFQATNYSAAFGRAGGGIVNLVSHTGTDKFHGSLWEYFRNSALDASNFFATKKPGFHQNQFGVALGGPIVRGKTFFYVSYEGFRQSKGITQGASVPTVAERNGDFSGGSPIYNPNQIDPITGLRVPFPNNQIPVSDFSTVAVNALSLFPLPNLPGTVNNLISAVTQTIDFDQVNARIDQEIGKDDSLAGRYTNLVRWNRNLPFTFSSLPNFSTIWDSPAQNAFISWTHAFGTTAVNEAKFGFNRNKQILQDPDQGMDIPLSLGITGTTTETKLLRNPNINISGLGGTGTTPNAPNDRTDNRFITLDNFTYSRGPVTYSAGVSIVREQDNGGANFGDSGIFNFNGTFTGQLTPSLTGIRPGTGNAVADYMLGFPASSRNCCLSSDGFRNWRKTDFGVYFQADWKVRPNFTVNMGLRYEVFQAPYEVNNRVAQPDLAAAPQAVLLYADKLGVPRGFYRTPVGDVSPRVGFAYSLNPKTVIRGGYGIFYISGELIAPFSMSQQPPFTIANSFVSSPITPQLTLANAFPSGLGLPSLTFTNIDLSFRDPYLQAWNVSVQREVGYGVTFTASYVASKGSRLRNSVVPANAPSPGPGPLASRRPIPGFSTISLYNNSGYSSYNSLQLRAEKRLSNQLSFLGSYTYSKCMDNGTTAFTYGGNRQGIRNPGDVAMNRGLCDFDIRNRFVLNAIYQLPFGNNSSGFLRQVVWGWSIEGILTLEGGNPFSVLYPLDNSNTGIGLDTPDRVVSQNPNSGPKTPNDWFNLDAFTNPVPFTYGNSGRNIVIGPGLHEFDLALHKQFPITESKMLQFRAEFFNFTNTPSFFQPGNVFNTPSFGVIGGAFDPREIQFSLKFLF